MSSIRYYFLLFIYLLFLNYSCSPIEKEVIIDNAGKDTITIQFQEGQIVELKPDTSIIINLRYGKQSVIINDDAVKEIILEDDYEYIINPSFSNYYLQTIIYFKNWGVQKRFYEKQKRKTTNIGAFELEGEYELIEGELLIRKNWHFGLDEDPTPQGKIKTPRDYFYAKKIHREKDIHNTITSELIKYLDEK